MPTILSLIACNFWAIIYIFLQDLFSFCRTVYFLSHKIDLTAVSLHLLPFTEVSVLDKIESNSRTVKGAQATGQDRGALAHVLHPFRNFNIKGTAGLARQFHAKLCPEVSLLSVDFLDISLYVHMIICL